jgi:hypothetical protein
MSVRYLGRIKGHHSKASLIFDFLLNVKVAGVLVAGVNTIGGCGASGRSGGRSTSVDRCSSTS